MASGTSDFVRGLVTSIQELVAHRAVLLREARSAGTQGSIEQGRMTAERAGMRKLSAAGVCSAREGLGSTYNAAELHATAR